MLSHTLYLEYLVLAGTIAPAELIRVATSFDVRPDAGSARLLRNPNVGVPGAYVLVLLAAIAVVISAHVQLSYLTSWATGWLWLLMAAGVGVAAVGLEALTGALFLLVGGNRTLRFRVSVHARQVNAGFLSAITLTAIAEEVLYRGIWIGIFSERLHLSYAVAIGSAALAYALGHLFFGTAIVGQKIVTGVVYGVILVASGSLLVPIVAHVCQNFTVFGIAAREGKKS